MAQEIQCPICYGNDASSEHDDIIYHCWLCKGLGTIPYAEWEKYMRGDK